MVASATPKTAGQVFRDMARAEDAAMQTYDREKIIPQKREAEARALAEKQAQLTKHVQESLAAYADRLTAFFNAAARGEKVDPATIARFDIAPPADTYAPWGNKEWNKVPQISNYDVKNDASFKRIQEECQKADVQLTVALQAAQTITQGNGTFFYYGDGHCYYQQSIPSVLSLQVNVFKRNNPYGHNQPHEAEIKPLHLRSVVEHQPYYPNF